MRKTQKFIGEGDQVAGNQNKTVRNATLGTNGQYIENYNNGIKIKHRLTHNPFFSPKDFLGREDELTEIHDILFAEDKPDNCLLLVNGEDGIGKTTLASCYYHRYQDSYTHVAWLLGDIDLQGAITSLANSLQLTFDNSADKDIR